MPSGAQLSVTDLRRSNRHPVDHMVIAEHRRLGDIKLHIVNLSAHGFMCDSVATLTRGERLTIRLPHVGVIESHLIWIAGERTGFQFERIVRLDDFLPMIEALQPNPRLRKDR
ncbi:MAG: hypothetical protein RLY97_156 [Pseudomonadota bacterium]